MKIFLARPATVESLLLRPLITPPIYERIPFQRPCMKLAPAENREPSAPFTTPGKPFAKLLTPDLTLPTQDFMPFHNPIIQFRPVESRLPMPETIDFNTLLPTLLTFDARAPAQVGYLSKGLEESLHLH